MEELEKKVLSLICERLGIDDVDVGSFDYDSPLFASGGTDGLGLDSVDALELVVILKQSFNVKVTNDDMKTLRTVRSVADFIREKTK